MQFLLQHVCSSFLPPWHNTITLKITSLSFHSHHQLNYIIHSENMAVSEVMLCMIDYIISQRNFFQLRSKLWVQLSGCNETRSDQRRKYRKMILPGLMIVQANVNVTIILILRGGGENWLNRPVTEKGKDIRRGKTI